MASARPTLLVADRPATPRVAMIPWIDHGGLALPVPRTHNIAKICERYGGGGHAVVGAVSLRTDEVEQGRVAMREIVAELSEQEADGRRQ